MLSARLSAFVCRRFAGVASAGTPRSAALRTATPTLTIQRDSCELPPKRPYICHFQVPHVNRTVRIEAGVPEDEALVTDFLNEIAVEREPTCRSTQTTVEEFRPFTQMITKKGLEESRYTLLAFFDGELVAASIGNRAEIDRSRVVETAVREDYKEAIDRLEPWIPSRKARRVVGPAYDLVAIENNFLPPDVHETLRLDLSGVRGDFVGGNIVRKLLYEQARIGLKNNLEWTDGQTTAKGTERAATVLGFKPVFAIPYERMYDGWERIHPKIPLFGGSTHLTLFLGKTTDIAARAEC